MNLQSWDVLVYGGEKDEQGKGGLALQGLEISYANSKPSQFPPTTIWEPWKDLEAERCVVKAKI